MLTDSAVHKSHAMTLSSAVLAWSARPSPAKSFTMELWPIHPSMVRGSGREPMVG
jgi:hypothetical protein